MDFGSENETRGFVSGMDELDAAVKMMTAMLNRFNKAEIYIGVGKDGKILDREFSEEDVSKVSERMGELINHMPQTVVSLERTEDGKGYIRISATGFETPYSFGSWFYVRRYRYVDRDGSKSVEWVENLTCGMKRHRSFSPVKRIILYSDTGTL